MTAITGKDLKNSILNYTRLAAVILIQLTLAYMVTWLVSRSWPVWYYHPEFQLWHYSMHMGLTVAVGVFLSGELAISLGWLPVQPKDLARLACTVAGAYFPIFLIVMLSSHSRDLTRFHASMLAAVVGFYIPNWSGWGKVIPESAADGALERHTVLQSLSLHLLPGAAILAFFVYALPIVKRAGYPSPTALVLAILVVQIPLEAGILLFEGWRRSRSGPSLPVIPYRKPLPLWQYFVLPFALLAAGILANSYLSAVEDQYFYKLWTWYPQWFNDLSASTSQMRRAYPIEAWLFPFKVALLVNGVFGSLVEEIYFRGYLLPRIPASRKLAPLVNTVLFSIYHFYAPGQILTRLGMFLPIAYTAESKRNIYSGIIAHCLMNIAGLIYYIILFSFSLTLD